MWKQNYTGILISKLSNYFIFLCLALVGMIEFFL